MPVILNSGRFKLLYKLILKNVETVLDKTGIIYQSGGLGGTTGSASDS